MLHMLMGNYIFYLETKNIFCWVRYKVSTNKTIIIVSTLLTISYNNKNNWQRIHNDNLHTYMLNL
jgi:hypothetical protein